MRDIKLIDLTVLNIYMCGGLTFKLYKHIDMK